MIDYIHDTISFSTAYFLEC
jgi:hypothetical protein